MFGKRFHPLVEHALALSIAAAVAALLVLWAWNIFVAELLNGPEIRFKHAIALVALAVVARFLLRASVGRHTTAE